MNFENIRKAWFSNITTDVLAGMTVALALIPEAIAFSIIAGVDPMVGLYASVCIAIVISFTGGRPAMISAATGATALLMVTLVRDHGLEYLFAATILTGVLQILFGWLKIARFLTFLPASVMIGFVNALAILIFMAQLPNFEGQGFVMYALVAATLAIIYLLPRLTKKIPSPLTAIIIVSIITISMGIGVPTVGDLGEMTSALPVFHIADVPLSLETLWIIFPYSLSIAMVGILESLLTATIVDEMTETKSEKNREVKGQGVANIVSGFFGGMAGCAMIGQSVINVKSGARTRLSTLTAGVFLLVLILLLGDIVKQIPMAALVGVMFMVSIGTFDWGSLRDFRKLPPSDSLVMVIVVAIVVASHNLAYGVLTGVVISALVYGWRSSRISVSRVTEEGSKTYRVKGPLFFGTTTHFLELFDYQEDPELVVIDFRSCHVWDHSAVVGISKVVQKYEALGRHVKFVGLNEESETLINRIGLVKSTGH
ncbi:MAG TPA: SulP family inorganic anion transporter [Bacilli bacterium]|nr:SulP family inorganic anion transporter [Bacilli bacterium]